MARGLFQGLRTSRDPIDGHFDKKRRLHDTASARQEPFKSGKQNRATVYSQSTGERPALRLDQVYADLPEEEDEWDDQDTTSQGSAGRDQLQRSRSSLAKGIEARQRKLRTAGSRVNNATGYRAHTRILSPLPPNTTYAAGRHDTLKASPTRKPRKFAASKPLMYQSPLKRDRARKTLGVDAHAYAAGKGHHRPSGPSHSPVFDALARKRKRAHMARVMTPPDSDVEEENKAAKTNEGENTNGAVPDDGEQQPDTDTARMSMDDEIVSDFDQEATDLETEDDDSFYLYKATPARLRRLRRSRLVDLATLLLDGGSGADEAHVSTATKDVLVKMIVDARLPTSHTSSKYSHCSNRSRLSSPHSIPSEHSSPPPSASDFGSSSDQDTSGIDGAVEHVIVKAPRNRTRQRPSRTKDVVQHSPIDSRGRSKSLPHLSDLNLSSQSSPQANTSGQSTTRRRLKSHGTAPTGLPTGTKTTIRRTRSRARLLDDDNPEINPDDSPIPKPRRRRGIRTQVISSKRVVTFDSHSSRDSMSSIDDDAEDDDDDTKQGNVTDDDGDAAIEHGGPTPIARRTRHSALQSTRTQTRPVKRHDGARLSHGSKDSNMSMEGFTHSGRGAAITQSNSRQHNRRHQQDRHPLQLPSPPSEENTGSDEGGNESSDGDHAATEDEEVEEDEEVIEAEEQTESGDDEGQEQIDTKHLTPRRLRSGRVVSNPKHGSDQESVENDESSLEGDANGHDTDEEASASSEDDDAVAGSHDEDGGNDTASDAEQEEEDVVEVEVEAENQDLSGSDDDSEASEDEGDAIDLDTITSKALLRLRRDNLVQLCAERELEVEGTKKDLVRSLLEWRDTNRGDEDDETFVLNSSQNPIESVSSVKSDSTVQQENTSAPTRAARAVQRRIPSDVPTPLLLRPDHVPRSKSATPDSQPSSGAENDVGELDLESLNLQDKEIAPEALKRLDKIGSGGFKDVYRGVFKKMPVAIADIRGHLTEMDLKELRILRDLRHENIVRFIGVSVPEDTRNVPVMIVTEICTNGDLFDYIRDTPAPDFGKILKIMRDIARGLEYLHTRTPTIIHRDLKSSNVLITARGVAKLNDFGLARIKNSTRSMVKSLVGTVNWQAPELWVPHPRYNEKVDVYSAGMVYWEALQWHQAVKRYPFEGQNEHAIYQDVGQKQLRPSTAGMRRQWGDDILDLIDRLWAQSPADRPNMGEVVTKLTELMAQWKAKVKSR